MPGIVYFPAAVIRRSEMKPRNLKVKEKEGKKIRSRNAGGKGKSIPMRLIPARRSTIREWG